MGSRVGEMAALEPVPQFTNSRSHACTHSGRDGARAPRHPLRPRGDAVRADARGLSGTPRVRIPTRPRHRLFTISRRAQLLEQGASSPRLARSGKARGVEVLEYASSSRRRLLRKLGAYAVPRVRRAPSARRWREPHIVATATHLERVAASRLSLLMETLA